MLKALVIMFALGATGVMADKCGDLNIGGGDGSIPATTVTE